MASKAATEDEPKDPVASIAGQVPHLSTGDRAALRRLYLTQGRRHDAEGIVEGLLYRAGVVLGDQPGARDPWRLLAHVAALLSGTGAQQPHAPGRRLGRALFEAGLSENRFLRLTTVRGSALEGQIVRAARMLAQAGQTPVDLWPFLHLAGTNPDKADEARVRIAQDYYAALAAS
jgi:CRISPR type I-E-associated protein CasB/Cse2